MKGKDLLLIGALGLGLFALSRGRKGFASAATTAPVRYATIGTETGDWTDLTQAQIRTLADKSESEGSFMRNLTTALMMTNPSVDYSAKFMEKVQNTPDEELAQIYREGGLPQTSSRVPVTEEDYKANVETIRKYNTDNTEDNNFTKIREGAYRQITLKDGIKTTRVIYT